jgi:tetratricopeptide (TPR) repeat protein
MSRTLSLVHGGLTAARDLARRGRRPEALTRLRQLLATADVPPATAAEAHRLAAELLIDRDRFGAARRHLRAALGLEPRCAAAYYLAGLASERDPAGNDRRAAVRFRRASELEPTNANYRAAFGRALVRAGLVNAGARALEAAADAADLTVLRVAVDGLLEGGRLIAARRVVQKARFLRPACASVAGLWNRVRFEAARRSQRSHRGAQDAHAAREGRPLLPFLRVVGGTEAWRGDVVSVLRPHFARLRATRG